MPSRSFVGYFLSLPWPGMKQRCSTDLLSGLLFIAFGAFVLVYGLQYPFGTSARMGPGYYPRVVSIGLILVGLILTVRSRFIESEATEPLLVRPLFVVALATAGFGLLIERAGLFAAAVLLIVAARLADRDFRPLEVAALCVVLIAFATAVFWYGLSLPFPLLPF
ncbi:MAG TPA: tripartite tricarboxylate transporter TctB family protein [Hyphomicrobiaceae bacterium]|nr:tripartite tricarboxylate transporter TctB family protein [Hyphomicrobiaceae bacterium]